MRAVLSLSLLALSCGGAGCGGSPPPASDARYGLTLHTHFAAPAQPPAGIDVLTARLQLTNVTAVSDRSSTEPRARVDLVDLSLGQGVDAVLPDPPPALYSGMALAVGDEDRYTLDIEGMWMGMRLHVSAAGDPFEVACPSPVSLSPGHPIAIALSTDMTHWFDGIDLSLVTFDADDVGIAISDDDNVGMASQVLANVAASMALTCTSD